MLSTLQRFGLLLAMLLSSAWLFAADLTTVPTLTAPVMDTAHMMSSSNRAQLNQHLLQYSQEKGSQIVVLTVPTIAPETPFDYATRVMQQWQLGRKGVNDGVLLLLVKNERKSFLAVGRGLEGAIPDVYAKRILSDVLRPYLQQGNTDQGIVAAVDQIEKLIAGENLPAATQTPHKDSSSFLDNLGFVMIAGFIGGGFLRALLGRVLGSVATGGLMFGIAMLLGGSLLLAILVGLFGLIFSLALGSGAFISTGGGGGWGGGSFGGGNFGGGGGFSGGGGDFGGGGASGNW